MSEIRDLRLGLPIPEELFTSRGIGRRAWRASNIRPKRSPKPKNRQPKVFVLWGSLLTHEPQMEPWLEMNKYRLELEVQARQSRKLLCRIKQHEATSEDDIRIVCM